MPTLLIDAQWSVGSVRVRASAADPFDGLRGHAYIAARNLNKPVVSLGLDKATREAAALNVLTQRGAIAPASPKTADPAAPNYVFMSGDAHWGPHDNRRFWVVDTKKRGHS
jgi:hypothetical protein